MIISLLNIMISVKLLKNFLVKKDEHNPVVMGAVIVAASLIMFWVNSFRIPWLNSVSAYTVCTIAAQILFKGNFALRFGFAVTVITIGAIGEMLPFFILLIISELSLNSLISNPVSFRLLGLMGVFIYYAIGSKIAKRFPRKYSSFSLSDMFLISFQILSTSTLLVIAHYTSAIQISFTANLLILLLQFSLLTSSVLVFFIFDSALHKRELETQIDYYKYQFEQIKASQTVIGRMEHDLEKHLLALKLDLKNSKTDVAEQKIDLLIGNLHLAEGVANSGNADVDAILNYKANPAKAHGIRMAYDLRLPYTLGVNTTDLTVIIGNALDNAIETCKAVETPERVINVDIRYDKPNLHMTFSSPFVGGFKTNAAGEFVTPKRDDFHGIGLKNMKEMVVKYDGMIDYAVVNNRFILKVQLCAEGKVS
jgi:hypothetical protein